MFGFNKKPEKPYLKVELPEELIEALTIYLYEKAAEARTITNAILNPHQFVLPDETDNITDLPPGMPTAEEIFKNERTI